jgi:hypothetical protein
VACAGLTRCLTPAAGTDPELLLLDGSTVPVSSVSDQLLSSFSKQQVEHMLQGLAWTVCKEPIRLQLQARQVGGSAMWQQQMLFRAGTCIRCHLREAHRGVSRLAA